MGFCRAARLREAHGRPRSASFVAAEVAPAVAHLQQMGVKNATERSSDIGYALYLESELHAAAESLRPFFDLVFDINEPIRKMASTLRLEGMYKAYKLFGIAASPFDKTLYLDFDSRPCRPTFAAEIFAAMDAARVPEREDGSHRARHRRAAAARRRPARVACAPDAHAHRRHGALRLRARVPGAPNPRNPIHFDMIFRFICPSHFSCHV